MEHGFLLVDKPETWTSHDVVAKVRSLIGGKVGHAGTLDPMATGLLVLGLGRCTRLLRYVQASTKEYEAEVVFGIATDTLDADGVVIEEAAMPILKDDLVGILPRFLGEVSQIPPMVSAVRVEGKRLHDLARSGVEIDRPARIVRVFTIDVLGFSGGAHPRASLRVQCGSGTYVRALADDMARALGGRAHLFALRRTRSGPLHAGDAHSMTEVELAVSKGEFPNLVLAPAVALGDLQATTVDMAATEAVRHGRELPAPSDVEEGATVVVKDEAGVLLGVYRRSGDMIKPETVVV